MSLVEVLTALVVVGIAFAILFPLINRMRDTSQNAQCSANVRQIAMLFLLYAGEHNGYFPKAAHAAGYTGGGVEWAPEHFMLAYDGFKRGEDGRIIQNAPPPEDSIFRCPAESSDVDMAGQPWFQSHYGYNRYLVTQVWNPNFGTNPCRIPVSSVQRPSEVFLVADARRKYGITSSNTGLPKRRHGRGRAANVAFVDGRVETTENLSYGWAQYIPWGGERADTNSPYFQ